MSDELPKRERLPAAAVKRVLDRATALDAEHGSSVPVDVLRAAAHEAGISAEAFDTALAEERRVPVTPKSRKPRWWVVFAVAAITLGSVVAIPSWGLFRTSPRPPIQIGAVEETFVLRCADQSTVSERVRASMQEKRAVVRMWYNSKETRVLHVRAMPDVMTKIRAEVVAVEEEAPTCAVPR